MKYVWRPGGCEQQPGGRCERMHLLWSTFLAEGQFSSTESREGVVLRGGDCTGPEFGPNQPHLP